MIAGIGFFIDSFANIVTITFSALILIELLNVYSSINKINYLMLLATFITLIMYIGSILIFHAYFKVGFITGDFLWKIALIAVIAWGPIFVFRKIYECIDPSEETKI